VTLIDPPVCKLGNRPVEFYTSKYELAKELAGDESAGDYPAGDYPARNEGVVFDFGNEGCESLSFHGRLSAGFKFIYDKLLKE